MSKSIKFKNNVYLDSSSIWYSQFQGTAKSLINQRLINMIPNTQKNNVLRELGHIKFNSHNQGSFTQLRIFIGAGNNSRGNQNAYIDLIMQEGWTGTYNGRVGCIAVLYAFGTGFTINNIDLHVTEISTGHYIVYFKTSAIYCRPNLLLFGTNNVKIEPATDYPTSADDDVIKVGTECDLRFYQAPAFSVRNIHTVT